LHARFREAVVDRARRENLGRRIDTFDQARKRLPIHALQELRDHYNALLRPIGEAAEKARDDLQRRLIDLADDVPVLPGPEFLELERVSGSAYMSVGLGCERYAEARAEQALDVARMVPVAVSVLRDERTGAGGYRFVEFVARAQVRDDLDLQVLRRRSGPTLREWVRMCWKRGVNPRVYQPFLAAGYEERVGLDYFGGERRAAP
jgi:hypothetical protein